MHKAGLEIYTERRAAKEKGHTVNTRDPQALIEKLKNLPPERVAEVEDFVDFLKTRDEKTRDTAAQRLGEAMAKLSAVDFPMMSEDEVQAEVEAARRERRARLGADRR